jgi:hypothetical protein
MLRDFLPAKSNQANESTLPKLSHKREIFQKVCLLFEGWMLLLKVEFILRFRGFKVLQSSIREFAVQISQEGEPLPIKAISDAMDLACVLNFKTILCLQRSAATTFMFRRHGLDAAMITGAQLLPFEFHAWCEIDSTVANDKPYMRDIFQVLDRW